MKGVAQNLSGGTESQKTVGEQSTAAVYCRLVCYKLLVMHKVCANNSRLHSGSCVHYKWFAKLG